MATRYRYNALNKPIWQRTPDGDTTHFYYDRAARLIASQDGEQREAGAAVYSYTRYDAHGRTIETGEVSVSKGLSRDSLRASSSYYARWLASGQKREITRTYYDAYPAAFDTLAGRDSLLGGRQHYLRNRVAARTYQPTDGSNGYQSATYYRYDPHGNVAMLVRDFPELAGLGHRYKRLRYHYDLISGNERQVAYQPGGVDQFFHRYTYDADNRIQTVATSRDSLIWRTDAGYDYYRHGPLARMQVGDGLVLGLDYAYTIQGWLKGVNSQSLTPRRDPGRDGDSGGLHARVGRDAFGFSLHYFPGDYHPTGDIPPDSMFLGGMARAPFWEDPGAVPDGNQYRALYNGNIAARAIHHQGLGGGDPRLTAYTYDQLNRLWASETYTGYDSAQNHWNDASPQPDYKTRYRYDLNGNLTHLDRMDGQATPGLMDKLTYHYQAGTNRLTHVGDATAANYADEASHGVRDFDGHSGPNYAYDRTGNLIADTAEHIRRIRWNIAGKVTAVERDTIKPDRAALDFRYGPDGRRLRKRVKRRPEQSHWTTTYYVRDAQGHPMATYHKRAFVVADTMGIPEVTAYLLDSLGLDSTAGLLQSQLSGQADYLDLLEAEVLDLDDQQKDNLLGRYSVGQFLDWDVTLYNSLLQGYPASDAGELYQYGLDQQSAATYATVYTCLHPGGPEGILEAIFNGPYPESIYNCALNLGMLWLIEEAYLNLYGAPPPSWMPHSQMVQDINMMPAADRAAVTASLIDEVLFETLVSCNPNVLPSFMQSYDANGNTYESRFPAALVSCDEAEHFHTYLHDQHGGAVGGDAYHNLLLNEAGNSYLIQLLRDQSNRFIKHSLLEANLTNPQLINQPLLHREGFFLQEYLSLVRDAVGEGPLFEGLQQRIVPFLRFREEWKLEAFYLYGSKRLGTMQLDSTLHAREFSISGFDRLGRFVVDSIFVDSTATILKSQV